VAKRSIDVEALVRWALELQRVEACLPFVGESGTVELATGRLYGIDSPGDQVADPVIVTGQC